MQPEIFTLPTINFVGGATQELRFNLKNPDGEVFNATGCTASFAVSEWGEKTNLFTVSPEFLADPGGVLSIMIVSVPAVHTRDLAGKYVYQITMIDSQQNVGIPNKGLMNIAENIDKEFIS